MFNRKNIIKSLIVIIIFETLIIYNLTIRLLKHDSQKQKLIKYTESNNQKFIENIKIKLTEQRQKIDFRNKNRDQRINNTLSSTI